MPTVALRVPGSGGEPREFLFFGRVAEYKGIAELLDAFRDLPSGTPARLTVAGSCDDPGLRARLASAAGVRLRLEHVPESEVSHMLASADVIVLPFRRVTTSGSAELALAHGRPLLIPDLPALADLPEDAVIRYDGSVAALTAAMADLAHAADGRLAVMSAAAIAYSAQASWDEIARATMAAMKSISAGSYASAHGTAATAT